MIGARHAVCWLLVLFPAAISVSAEESDKAASINTKVLSALNLTDVTGRQHQPFDDRRTKAVVLLFVSTDCPVANTFQPYLQDFERVYAKKGVRCFMVYCSPGLEREQIDKHTRDFQIHMSAVLDAKQQLARITGAKVTPEAIMIDRSGKVRYRGLINDLYAGYGRKRAQPTKHFLRDACDAVIAGKMVPNPVTKSLGCFIHFETSEPKATK